MLVTHVNPCKSPPPTAAGPLGTSGVASEGQGVGESQGQGVGESQGQGVTLLTVQDPSCVTTAADAPLFVAAPQPADLPQRREPSEHGWDQRSTERAGEGPHSGRGGQNHAGGLEGWMGSF